MHLKELFSKFVVWSILCQKPIGFAPRNLKALGLFSTAHLDGGAAAADATAATAGFALDSGVGC